MPGRTRKSLRIEGGYDLLMKIFSPYRKRIYRYNEKIRESGYYLKPIHIVYRLIGKGRLKYIYFGRYWYRIYRSREGKRNKLRWIYVGRDKPDPHLPEPPINPLEGLAVIVKNDDVLIDEKTFEALIKIAENLTSQGLIKGIELKRPNP